MAVLKDTLIQGSARVTDTLYANIVNIEQLKAKEIIPGQADTNDASDISGNINFYHTNNTVQGHIGFTSNDTATSAALSIYSRGIILLRPKVAIASGKFLSDKGIKIDDTSITPAAASGTGAMSLGTASLPWTNVYATNLNGTLTTSSLSGQVAVENGGTGKASWTQWGLIYADTSVSLNQVSAGTNTYYNNKFQVLTSNGAAAPTWKTALLMDYDMPTLASMSITDINAAPIGVTRITNSTEIASISHRPTNACGGMIYRLGGYNGDVNKYEWQFFLGVDYDRSFVRHMDGNATWGQWYRMPRISGTVNTAIGGSKTPVYVSADGEIVAGNQLKNLAYKDSLAASDIPTLSITDKTSGTLTVARGGTGVTSFTNDCVIVATGTTQTLVSRGLKVTGAAGANITLSPDTAGKTMTISSTTGAMTISSTTAALTVSSTTGNMTLGTTGAGKTTLKSGTGDLAVTSGATLYMNRPTGASIVFQQNNTETARFNQKSNLQLGLSHANQDTYKLAVGGSAGITEKLSFISGSGAGNLTENASMQYDSTLHAIKFIVT